MVMAIQSIGNWQAGVGVTTVGDGSTMVADGVRVGSPGSGVSTMIVGVNVLVIPGVLELSKAISGFTSANEITKLPPTMKIETRAARSPKNSSWRSFIATCPPHLS
jgi:hypothetical protein